MFLTRDVVGAGAPAVIWYDIGASKRIVFCRHEVSISIFENTTVVKGSKALMLQHFSHPALTLLQPKKAQIFLEAISVIFLMIL